MEEVQFSSLLEKSSLADRARLLSITSPHAAAWISVTPSISQGLHLLPNEFQVAVQWWLGINPSPTSSQDGSLLICPFCPSSTLDTLGHHCVTCRCGGDVTTRHNALRNMLYTIPFIAQVCQLILKRVAVGVLKSQSLVQQTF